MAYITGHNLRTRGEAHPNWQGGRREAQRRSVAKHREKRNAYTREYCRRTYPARRERVLERSREWRRVNPDKIKARDLRRFNLSRAQYDAMIAAQDGKCAICRRPETRTVYGKVTSLAIDHDRSCCPERARSCGRCVRGLLCYHCNTAIGLFEDNPEALARAIEYVSRRASTIDGGVSVYDKATTVGA